MEHQIYFENAFNPTFNAQFRPAVMGQGPGHYVQDAPVGGEALTPGMESLVQLAANSGYAVDPERVRQFKANARLVTTTPQTNKQ